MVGNDPREDRTMTPRLLKVLFVCTHNAARSQVAEALLLRKGRGRFLTESAGSHPAAEVNPLVLEILAERGIEWRGRPKGFAGAMGTEWDFVITLCDRAREMCPMFPGGPIYAHWGIPDPSAVEGDRSCRKRALDDAAMQINARIDLMLALPQDALVRAALEQSC